MFGALADAVGKAAGQAGRGLAKIRTRSALRARGETVTPLHADGQVAVALMDAARVAAEASQIAVATAALTSDFADMVEQNAAVAASTSSSSSTVASSTTASAPEGKSEPAAPAVVDVTSPRGAFDDAVRSPRLCTGAARPRP